MSPDRHPEAGLSAPVPLGTATPLAEAARRLLDRTPDPLGEIDLSSVVVVTPGRRAGRQLLVALDEIAGETGIRFVAPRFTTAPELDETLAVAGRPAAADDPSSVSAVAMAVVEAAKGGPDEPLRWLPHDPDPLEAHALARRLLDADRALRAGGRRWEDAAAAAERRGGDGDRYRGIAAVLASADLRLGELGLVRRDDAIEAAIETLEAASAPTTGVQEIVLIGVVDLGPRDARLLEAASASGIGVRPFVIGDADRVSSFDHLGAVRVDAWTTTPPIVPVESIRLEARPMDAALALVDWLDLVTRESGDRLDPDRVAIVMADEAMGETMRRELEARGASVHLGQGRSPLVDGPARTLERLASWFETPDSLGFGGLLADPAIDAAVRAGSDIDDAWADWAAWAADQMPRPIEAGWTDVADEAPDFVKHRAGRLAGVESATLALLAIDPSAGPAPLPTQVDRLVDLLARIDATAADRSPWSESALRAVRAAADRLSAIPDAIAPRVEIRDAILMLLEALQRESQPDPGLADALETIGWLEAPFDPAARIAVVGLHDAAVPGGSDDPLLPDSLRVDLGLENAARRTARDAWVLATILGRDPDALVVIPREDGAGERLTPSRLLFGDRGVALADRVTRLFTEVPPRAGAVRSTSAFGRFRPPTDAGGIVRPTMSVTEFKLFLESPYRYWLRYGLGLRAEAPAGRELDARHFGTVLHAAVEAFGRNEIARLRAGGGPLVDAEDIHAEMIVGMHEAIAGIARGEPSPGLRLQTRILEQRLRRVAEQQASRALEGWRIHAVEWKIDRELELLDGPAQRIKGRIDRIDRHDDKGWMLLDFKTSDSGKRPDPAHRRRDGTWLDLQLPLYRWAAAQEAEAPSVEDIRSGYFVVGGRPDRIGIQESKKIDPLQDEAMDVAREVVRSVRAGLFDDLGPGTPYPDDPVTLLMRSAAVGDAEGGLDA